MVTPRHKAGGAASYARTRFGRAYLERQAASRDDTIISGYADTFQLTFDGYRIPRPDYTEEQEGRKNSNVDKKTIRGKLPEEPYPTDKQLYFIASRLGPGIEITSRTEASFIIDQMIKFPNQVMDCQRDAILERQGVKMPTTQREAKIMLMKLFKEYNGKRSHQTTTTDQSTTEEGNV